MMSMMPNVLRALAAAYLAVALTHCGQQAETRTDVEFPPSTMCADPHRILAANVRGLPPPPIREGIGDSALVITTSSPEAQAYFNNGLNLLHDFWEFEAYRAFLRATQLDPDCAMAYWGIVMCMPGGAPEFASERQHAMERLALLEPKVTPHEKAYIAALRRLVTDGTDVFANAMEAIYREWPDDIDAGAMAAYYLKSGYDEQGKRRPNQDGGIRLIEELLKKSPNHTGALHYAIHLYELGPEVELAIPLADRIAATAPAAGHIVHMPGHVRFFTGDYEGARAQFLKAYEVDAAYLKKEGVSVADHKNLTHNLHFLALACAESGRMKEAIEWAAYLRTQEIATARLGGEGAAVVAYEGRSLAARMLIRAGRWSAAVADLDKELEGMGGSPLRSYLECLRSFASGMGALAQGESAATALGQLLQQSDRLQRAVGEMRASTESFYAGRASSVASVMAQVLRAATSSSPAAARIFLQRPQEDDSDQARLDPPLLPMSLFELEGAIMLQLGDLSAAREAYNEALRQRPNCGYAWAGLARVEMAAGDLPAAEKAIKNARASWPGGDEDLVSTLKTR